MLTVCDDSDTPLLQAEGGALVVRSVQDKALLRCIAGLENRNHWKMHWQPAAAARVRYWFDCWPQPWMGLTVAEELAFGQSWSEPDARAVLSRWQLADLALDAALLELTRFDAIGVMLARAELGQCDLLLMEQPDAGLSDAEVRLLTQLLQSWLQRSGAIGIITTNRELY